MKLYYLLLDPTLKPPVKTYWYGESKKSDFLLDLRGYVIPLGKNKPKNVSRETSYGEVFPGKIYNF